MEKHSWLSDAWIGEKSQVIKLTETRTATAVLTLLWANNYSINRLMTLQHSFINPNKGLTQQQTLCVCSRKDSKVCNKIWRLANKDFSLFLFSRSWKSKTMGFMCVSGCVWPRSAEAPEAISVPDTQPDSGRHLHPLGTKFVPENIRANTHGGQNAVSQFNHIPVSLLCGSVCLVCSLCCNSTEKETTLTADTKLPSCVYKTNKPWSYSNRRVRAECECSTDQTTVTIVWQAVCSSLIICSSNGSSNKLHSRLSVGSSSI